MLARVITVSGEVIILCPNDPHRSMNISVFIEILYRPSFDSSASPRNFMFSMNESHFFLKSDYK